MKQLLMDLIKIIKLHKDGLGHGHFAFLDVSRYEQTALIFSTDLSLSGASGALLNKTTNCVEKKKQVHSSSAFFNHPLLGLTRPLIF